MTNTKVTANENDSKDTDWQPTQYHQYRMHLKTTTKNFSVLDQPTTERENH